MLLSQQAIEDEIFGIEWARWQHKSGTLDLSLFLGLWPEMVFKEQWHGPRKNADVQTRFKQFHGPCEGRPLRGTASLRPMSSQAELLVLGSMGAA